MYLHTFFPIFSLLIHWLNCKSCGLSLITVSLYILPLGARLTHNSGPRLHLYTLHTENTVETFAGDNSISPIKSPAMDALVALGPGKWESPTSPHKCKTNIEQMTLFLFSEEKNNVNSIMISKKCSKIKTLSGDDPPSSSLISIFGKSSDREREWALNVGLCRCLWRVLILKCKYGNSRIRERHPSSSVWRLTRWHTNGHIATFVNIRA